MFQKATVSETASSNAPTEWRAAKRWNPFNSYKLLAHVARWRQIERGRVVPPPVLITVDPANACNFDCAWCNAKYVREQRNFMLSHKTLSDIARFLPRWGEGSGYTEPGVKAICVAGGGEPLLNKATPSFIEEVCSNGVEVGVVTNGSLMHECVEALSRCTWVGVSVDAGSAGTLNKQKGLDPSRQEFGRIMDNIARLADYAKSHSTRLGKPHPSYGVSYKYLLYKENIGEVYQAAKLAKETGCKSIHYRPAGTTWNNVTGGEQITFSDGDIALFNEQIALAQELDDKTFSVFGVTHKFDSQFGISNTFERCHAIFMTAVISPPLTRESPKDAFVLGLCCDRRGDAALELLQDCADVEQIEKAWGGERHWAVHDAIQVRRCPRCTYQPHNQIYEQVILNDSMTYKFI
ncbi:MAG: radical SAM protein [Synergistaceae bacterium]|jgi:MoaA/NifB/PqqE/SkfB family radical SAM enzyme|nr:radical SAM protein [Synergistaceae bacterium]